MTSTSPTPLPRPEDRCRGDLERWVGCLGPGPNARSEGFAEDVASVQPAAAAAQPVHRRAARPLLWTERLGLLRG